MPTDDQQVLVTGTASTPATFTIPGNGQIRPKAIFASYDGTGAAGAFAPALKIVSDGGETVGIYKLDSTIAAGASADVSWFPWLSAVSSSNPILSNQLDYVEITSTVNCSAGTEPNPVKIIETNSIAFDGATRVRIEAYSGHYDMSTPGGSGNFLINLFMDNSNLGRFGTLNSNATNSNLGVPYYGVRYLTPSAGAHRFSIRGWTTTGSTINFECGPGGNSGQELPGYMRVSS